MRETPYEWRWCDSRVMVGMVVEVDGLEEVVMVAIMGVKMVVL